MAAASNIEEVKKEMEHLARNAKSASDFMSQVVKLLRQSMPKYNWVGFYMLEAAEHSPILALGAFDGAPTPHTRIPLNQGICGAAASSGKTIVVDDVSSDPRYLACSLDTKSEIVVPIFVRGEVVGELDIDSHSHAAFQDEDRKLVEYCAALVGKRLIR